MRSTAAVHEDLPNLRWSTLIRSYTPVHTEKEDTAYRWLSESSTQLNGICAPVSVSHKHSFLLVQQVSFFLFFFSLSVMTLTVRC